MNNQTRGPGWLKEPTGSILFVFIINLILVMSPMAFSIAPIIIPVFLLYVLEASGKNTFVLAAGAGLMPYLVLGGSAAAVAIVLPMILMTAALYFVGRLKLTWQWSLTVTALVILAALVINGWFSIYYVSGSDFLTFTGQLAGDIRTQLGAAMAVEGVELPLGQQQAIQDVMATITPEFVQDLIPAMVISWAFLGGYLTLRFARRYLRAKAGQAPWFAVLRMEPLLLFAFIALATVGFFISAEQPRLGSLLFNTGYGVSAFLGAVGALSMMWWSLSVNFRMRRKLPKLLLLLMALFYFIGDWMTLVAILDSVFDFRNTTGKSLWRWITYQLGQRAMREE